MDVIEKQLSGILKESGKLEGGLFAEITLRFCGRDYVARRDLYTVLNGVVYGIGENGSLFETGDSLWNLERDCYRIGKYNPDKPNKFKSSSFSYSEIKKALKL